MIDYGEFTEFSSSLLPSFFPTEDIWDKFQLSSLDLNISTSDIDLSSLEFFDTSPEYEIRNHDCMWAGHCGSKEHSLDDVKNVLVRPISQMFQPTTSTMSSSNNNCTSLNMNTTPVANKQSPIAPGRSLLLKTQPQQILMQQQQLQYQQPNGQMVYTPIENPNHQNISGAMNEVALYDSPPNSDDEETKPLFLKYLEEAISECDMDDDELYEYINKDFSEFAQDEEVGVKVLPEEEEQEHEVQHKVLTNNQNYNTNHHQGGNHNSKAYNNHNNSVKTFGRSGLISQFVNDHCYHKDKNASMRNLGIDTPSDSEEEIDVVSTDDKHMNPQRAVSALPTNPTTKDRQQIQKTMASAITKNGIRTIIPRKSSPASAESSPSKRRAAEVRGGIKRNRHRMPISPYKKHRVFSTNTTAQVSSDSEQENSEKRIEHNNMERQRRVDLRNAFEELRVLVPEVNKRERAPKVVILREAAIHCHKLTDISDAMRRQVDEMRRQQKRLRMRLSQLRLSLAPKHR